MLSFLFAGCATRSGEADARRDLAHGLLVEDSCGTPVPWYDEYKQLLRERYGIEFRSEGCVVDDAVLSYAKGYNKVMDAEIERRFGTNFWDKTTADAEALYERKRQAH